MEKYFQKFPEIYYKNVRTKDLSRRVKISEETRRMPNIFYPLEINSGLRPDVLADAYYEDPEIDWLVYLTNTIVDPYYGWYLNEEEFLEFINDKYGSFETANKLIKYYRNNWFGDDTEISAAYYDNVLPYDLKKYYSPNFGQGSKVMSYSRKKVDWVMNTNKILQYNISLSSNTVFSAGELIDIRYTGEDVGTGEVVFSNTSTLIIKNVSGNTSANTTHTKQIVGETTGAEATADFVYVLQELISNAEARFWEPVTMYEYEVEVNEAKKHLQIIDSQYALEIAEELRQNLKE